MNGENYTMCSVAICTVVLGDGLKIMENEIYKFYPTGTKKQEIHITFLLEKFKSGDLSHL
jgi:hypothetical protein